MGAAISVSTGFWPLSWPTQRPPVVISQIPPILHVFNDIRAGRERHWRSHSSLRHCPARHCERPRPLPWPRAGSALSPHRGWGKTRKVPVPRCFRRVLCCRRKRGLSFRRPSRASPRRRARFTVRTPAPVVLAARHLVLPGRSASARPLSLNHSELYIPRYQI